MGLGSQVARAQVLEGTVRRAEAAVPFVNIGLPHRGVGTVSDEQGHYRLPASPTLAADTVRISSVGYRPVLLTVGQLRQQPNVLLVAEPVDLGEVSVVATNTCRRTHDLGFTRQHSQVAFTMAGNELGTELGTTIHLDRSPTALQRIHLAVLHKEAGPLLLRVNAYQRDDQGRPTEKKLVHRDLLLTTPNQPGLLAVDVSPDHLVMHTDFLLAIEWVKGPGTATTAISKQLAFSGGLEQGRATPLYAPPHQPGALAAHALPARWLLSKNCAICHGQRLSGLFSRQGLAQTIFIGGCQLRQATPGG